MERPRYQILFLCTGNSARSIMAEGIVNHLGKGLAKAFSAGSHPRGEVHPLALETLRRAGISVEGFRSKSWDEFAAPGSPALDFVFTVCDNAARESCPAWPGQPMTAHWGVPDPARREGTRVEQERAFQDAFLQLQFRIRLFLALPLASLDRMSIQTQLHEIGARCTGP